jgi:photosystem II stability/assembly factor-like uncharacterized protein
MSRFKYLIVFGTIFSFFFTLISFCKNSPEQKSSSEGKKKQYPSDWYFTQRAYPYDSINPEAYLDAARQAQSFQKRGLLTRNAANWLLAGPNNGGGRITSLAVHPSNPQTIYVGAAAGGIFKTTNGGTSWNPIFDSTLTLAIGDVAVAPSNPQILYVGTGEANGGGGSTNYDGVGVYKTQNGGTTWQHMGPTSIGSIGKVVIDPKNPDRVFVAAMGYLYAGNSKRGVYRTINGGSTWEKVLYLTDSTGCIDLAIHPTNPDTIYAAMWERIRRPNLRDYGGSTCGIFRSVNGGQTWAKMQMGLPTTDIGRIGITISPKDPSVLYAIYANESGDYRGTYRSSNNGVTWTNADPTNNLQYMYSGFGWWFGKIYADPTDANIVYALGIESYRSDNGGQTWQTFTQLNHVDHHALWINPNDNKDILDGNDGGLYRTNDFSKTWSYINNIPISQFYTCEIDEQNPQKLFGGTQDNGTWRNLSPAVDSWIHILGGDGFYCLVNPKDSRYVYAESQYGNLSRSEDGGDTFSWGLAGINSFDRKNWQVPIAFSTANPATLYMGTHKIYRSTDHARNWSPLSPDLTRGSGGQGGIIYGTITTIGVSPKNAQIIYVGTDDGLVWVTTDEGANWRKITNGVPNRWITRLEADPFDASTAYLTVSGFKWNEYQPHVLKTTNLGETWVDISSNLPQAPANDIVPDPSIKGTLYVATDMGVFVTRAESAGKWELLGTGMPLCPVTDLKFHKATRKLVAATFGRSMYYANLPAVVGIKPDKDVSEFRNNSNKKDLLSKDILVIPTVSDLQFQKKPQKDNLEAAFDKFMTSSDINNTVSDFTLSPSPLTSSGTIHFTLKTDSQIQLDIVDISGRVVKTLMKGVYTEGVYQETILRQDLSSSGIYLCRLKVKGQVKTMKFMVL